MTFRPIACDEPIRHVLQAAFEANLDVSGCWGYDKDRPIRIDRLLKDHTLVQMEHMLASMRTYLEMHLTLPKEKRYGSINLNELKRQSFTQDSKRIEKVIYRIEAIKESDYEALINEYKNGYGKADFDMQSHFEKRKKATLQREIDVWFDVSAIPS